MRWQRLVLWSTCGLLALLVLGIIWLLTADLGVFKPQLERFVSERTGRDFVIEGSLEIDLGSQVVVIAEQFLFESTDWTEDQQMLEVGRIELRVDTWSLFRGPIRIHLIDLTDTNVRLEKRDSGESNWALPVLATDTGDSDTPGPDVLFEQVDIDRVNIKYASPARAGPIDLHIERLRERHRDDDFLDLSMHGRIGDRHVSLDALLGPWESLLAQKDLQFEFEGQLDTLAIASQGYVDDLGAVSKPSLTFTARGPDINDLARLLQVPEGGVGNIDVSGSITPADDGGIRLELDGNIGQTQIAARGAFTDLQDLEQLDFNLHAAGPSLGRITRLFGLQHVQDEPFTVDIDAQRSGSELIIENASLVAAEAEIDLRARVPGFPDLDDSNLNLKVAGPEFERLRKIFRFPGTAMGAYSLDFGLNVADDGIEIVKLKAETTLGKINAEGRLGDAPDYVGSEIQFEFDVYSLDDLARGYGLRDLPDKSVTLSGKARLDPDGVRTIGPITLASHDHIVRLEGLFAKADGIVGSNLAFSLTGPDLAALIATFEPVPQIPALDYDVRGRLRVQNNGFQFSGVSGAIGSSSITLDGLLKPARELAGTHLNTRLSGHAIEELVAEIEGLQLRPGPYTLSGDVLFESDAISFEGVEFARDHGQVNLDLELGLPVSRRDIKFDMQAKGENVRSVFGGVDSFVVDETPFFVDGRGNLRGSQLSIRKLIFRIGDAVATASGQLGLAASSRTTKFRLDVNVPNLARLGTFDGLRMREQSFNLGADLSGRNGLLTIDGLTVGLGESSVSGAARIERGEIPGLSISARSDLVKFTPLFEDIEPAAAEPLAETGDGRLIPDVAIPFDLMKKANVTAEMQIAELQRNDLTLRNIKLDSELRDGSLHLNAFEFQALAGWLKARGHLVAEANSATVSLDVRARDFTLWTTATDANGMRTNDIDLSLTANGADLRSLAGNSDGVVFLRMRGGELTQSRFLQKLYGDVIKEIFSTINPFSKTDPVTKIECIIAPLEITGGSLQANPHALISTDKLRIAAGAAVNLKTEKLEVTVRTQPRKGVTISAAELINPYLKIVGTLAAPRLAVDAQGSLVTGGVAVATGGLSILAKAAWDRMFRRGDPCGTTAAQAVEALGDRFPNFALPPGE